MTIQRANGDAEDEPAVPEDEQELQSISISAERSFSGPIPPPWLLSQYEEILPGSADRIMTMAELETATLRDGYATRHRIAEAVAEEDGHRTRRGMYLGGALGGGLLVVAVVLALEGATWPAVVAAISQLVPTLAVFIPNARARWRDRQKR